LDFKNDHLNQQVAACLQSLRIEQNVTLEQLSQKSQVPVVHLMSIEEGRFCRFDDFYLKLYLNRYAKILGVNLEQVYAYAIKNNKEALGDEVASPITEQATPVSPPPPAQPQMPQRIVVPQKRNLVKSSYKKARIPRVNLAKGLVFLFLAVLGVAFIFFLIGLFSNLGNSGTPDEPPVIDNPHGTLTTTEPAVPEETEPATEPDPEDATTIEPDSHVGRTQTFDVVTSSEEVTLRIEFEADCWLELRFDGHLAESGVFNDYLEETLDLSGGQGSIDINFGNLFGVESITINGVEVDYNNSQSVQRLIFNIVSE